jgi:hypothetical protein
MCVKIKSTFCKQDIFSRDKAGIVHHDQALRQAAGQAFYNTAGSLKSMGDFDDCQLMKFQLQ